MKILWLSHLVPYPPHAGVAQRSYGLLKELACNHQVTLLAFHQPGLMRIMSRDPEREIARSVDHLRKLLHRVDTFEIPSERSSLHRYGTALSSLVRPHPYTVNWLDSRAFDAAVSAAAQEPFDIVHFDTISLAGRRKLLSNRPAVMNHHNIESHLLIRRAGITVNPLARWYYRQEGRRLQQYERSTAGDFDVHLTCSELDAERLREVAPQAHVRTIPNGVDLDFFPMADKQVPARPTFVFVGTLGWGPNRDAALRLTQDIWPRLAADLPDSELTLVGSEPPAAAVAEAQRSERFHVTGFAEDVRPYMARAGFFVCPIRDGGGTKLKILNAMAMGSVVIADPVAAEGIDARDGREIVIAREVDDYAAAARELLADPDRYVRISTAARKLIESRFGYGAIVRSLEGIYRNAIESHTRTSGGPG